MKKVLMKGNEAFAEGCIRAGCRFYSGYPITPQTEILEYMSWRMEEEGGVFVQTASEIEGIYMLFGAASCGVRSLTTSSGPGFSMKQEGISYLCASDVPAVIADVMRIGSGLGDIFQGQGDYWQLTRGGGHGDYRTIVLAPCSVQENVDLAALAFNLAEAYRHPVLIASDAAIGQMLEPVSLPPFRKDEGKRFDWALREERDDGRKRLIWNIYYDTGAEHYPAYLKEKYSRIEANEQRWESFRTEDAEIVLVAYGISARICRSAVKKAREQGIRLGLIRPITLWPFPEKAFREPSDSLRGYLCVEMSILGQMCDDVRLACKGRFPVGFSGEFANVPSEDTIIREALQMIGAERSSL